MKALVTISYCLNEKQFTQLAKNLTKGNFVVSVYFRCTNTFNCIEYIRFEDAEKFYNAII